MWGHLDSSTVDSQQGKGNCFSDEGNFHIAPMA